MLDRLRAFLAQRLLALDAAELKELKGLASERRDDRVVKEFAEYASTEDGVCELWLDRSAGHAVIAVVLREYDDDLEARLYEGFGTVLSEGGTAARSELRFLVADEPHAPPAGVPLYRAPSYAGR